MIKKAEKINEFLRLIQSLKDAMYKSVEYDQDNIWKYGSYIEYINKYNEIVLELSKYLNFDSMIKIYDSSTIRNPGQVAPIDQKIIFDSVYVNICMLEAYLINKTDIKTNEIQNIKNFLDCNLRKAIFEEPDNEKKFKILLNNCLLERDGPKELIMTEKLGE